MSTRWKKVVSIIGISAMLATNSIGVMAEEAVDGNEIASVETDTDQPEDPSADGQSGDSENGEQLQGTTANNKPENPVIDDKANSGQSGDNENRDQSGESVTDDRSEDAAAEDQLKNEGTDDKTEDAATDAKAEDRAEDDNFVNDGVDDKAEAGEMDGKTENIADDQSADGIIDHKPKDTTTDDQSENTIITNDQLEDVVTKPEDAITDEQQGDVVPDEGIAALAEDETTGDETEAAIPTELGWSDTKIGHIRFKHNEYVESNTTHHVEYYMETYKNGELINRRQSSFSGRGDYCEMSLLGGQDYDFTNHKTRKSSGLLDESATYKYRLKVRESNETSNDFSEGKVSEYSSEYHYIKPDEERLPVPQNVRWSSSGVLEWDAVEGADSYMIDMKTGEYSGAGGHSRDTKCDLTQYIIDDNYNYVAVVCACASKEDGRTIYSDYSAEVTYKTGETNAGDTDSVATIVDKVNADSTPEAVSSAVTELANQYQGEEKNKLQIAMQTSDETQAQVKKLDDLYAQKANIETKAANIGEGVALDSSKVSMVGAALNASEGASIQMNIRKPEPDKDVVINNKDYWENTYGNAVQFSMDVTGINSPEDLAIPITITMPIPNGLNPERLVILHQQADGQLERIINKVDQETGTVRFTITHFSEFIFAETASAGDDNNKPGTGDDNNKPGTGEDANKPGTGDDNNTSSNEGTENKPGTSSSNHSSSSSSSASSPAVTVPKTKAPMVGKSEGWNSLGKEVNEAIARKAEGTDAVVWVKLNDAEIIPANVLLVIAGKDVTVCFETKTGVIVNVNGSLLTPNAVGEIKIISNKGKDGSTSLKIRNTAPDMNQAIVIFVKAQTGAQDQILYFVDAANELISFRTSETGTNGYAAFEVPFVNANYTVK